MKQLDLAFINRTDVSQAAFRVLNALQDHPLDQSVTAIGMLMELICEQKHIQPSDVMAAVHNMVREKGLVDDQFIYALREFIREELPNVR